MIRNSWLLTALTATTLASALFLSGCRSNEPASGGQTSTTGSSATNPAPSGDTIKIGLVASRNGDLRPWGEDSVNGATLAVEEINKAGGINGKQIELLVEDSASKPEEGKAAAEKLASQGVVALVGEVASGITAQMKIVALEKGLPLVAVGATRTDLAENRNGLFFRVCYTDDFQGPVMAKFAYEELNLRRIALMTDQKAPYSTGLSDSFRKKFEALGGKIVTEQFYQSGENQFTGQITNAKAANPDGIFMSGYFPEVGPMARQIRQQGLSNVRLLGGDGWDSTELVSGGGDAIIGGFFCNHYNNTEDRPEVKEFLKKWEAKWGGTPGTTMGALGYDSIMLVADGLRRASAPESKALAEALESTEGFKGVSGAITLKGMNGNPPKRALVVEVTREGQVFRKAYEPGDL